MKSACVQQPRECTIVAEEIAVIKYTTSVHFRRKWHGENEIVVCCFELCMPRALRLFVASIALIVCCVGIRIGIRIGQSIKLITQLIVKQIVE